MGTALTNTLEAEQRLRISGLAMNSRTVVVIAVLFFLLSVSQLDATSEEQNTPWKAALEVLRQAKRYDSSGVGYAGVRTETYEAYEVLRDTAPSEELERLTSDANAIVRVYAFEGLYEKRSSPRLFQILERHFTDEESIDTLIGCIGSEAKVADMMINFLEGDLEASQRNELAWFLLTKKNNLEAKDRVLEDWALGPEFYAAVRALVGAGEPSAIEALARYREEEDVDLILGVLKVDKYHAFRAIQHFQHPKLWTALKEQSDEVRGQKQISSFIREYFHAVASFRTQESAAFLDATIGDLHGDLRNYYLETILGGMSEYASPLYSPLYFRLWLENSLLTVPALEELMADDPGRTVHAVEETLARDVNTVGTDVLSRMLKIVVSDRTPDLVRALDKAACAAGPVAFSRVARAITDVRADSSIDVLIKRLHGKWQPYIILPAAEALMAYDRPYLSELVRSTLSSIGRLREGYWAEKAKLILARQSSGMEEW